MKMNIKAIALPKILAITGDAVIGNAQSEQQS
jgi:hypothetical protein